jgi:hypothetical protein
MSRGVTMSEGSLRYPGPLSSSESSNASSLYVHRTPFFVDHGIFLYNKITVFYFSDAYLRGYF